MNKNEIDEAFVDKYTPLVSSNVCKEKGIDENDSTSKAILAQNMLNPNDPIMDGDYKIEDTKKYYVLSNGDIVDAQRGTYVSDMISDLLDPEEFRNTLFANPTYIQVNIGKGVSKYEGSMMYATNLLSLEYVFKEMLYAVNYFVINEDSVIMKNWRPLIKALHTLRSGYEHNYYYH